MDYPRLALDLYLQTRDPLVLDAIRVLANPDDPVYQQAKNLIDSLLEAKRMLEPVA